MDGALDEIIDALAADHQAELLKEQGESRQILLFSCHGREAAWAEANGVPVITL